MHTCRKICGDERGQSLSEYGLVAAIVAVLAIPAMILLGGSLNQLLGGMVQPPGAQQAAVAAVASGQTGGGSPMGSITYDQLLDGGAMYDPTSGEFIIPLPLSQGGGMETVSENGSTELLSKRLIELAENWRNENGEPLPDTLKLMLTDLGENGHSLADQELEVIALGLPEGTVVDTNNVLAYQQYNNLEGQLELYLHTHLAIENYLKSTSPDDPRAAEYAELLDVINVYTGVIAKTSYDNFLTDSPSIESASYIKAIAAMGTGLGTPPQQVADNKVDSEKETRSSSEAIDQLVPTAP